MAGLNSELESEGAEFLVLGELLIEGVVAYKTYTRTPEYDLIAVNPDKGTSARIQVKSRWATDFDGGFLISKFDCDFVAFVSLNRGNRYAKKNSKIDGKRAPDIYLFPVEIVQRAQYAKSSWGKSFLNAIPEVASYLGNWGLVKDYLSRDLSAK